ncbi:MAG: hypothetical protein HKN91_00470 [Acidimicrobiia bacterium]|nr:hypothetical protein [Acidimicrobiia bacterium]
MRRPKFPAALLVAFVLLAVACGSGAGGYPPGASRDDIDEILGGDCESTPDWDLTLYDVVTFPRTWITVGPEDLLAAQRSRGSFDGTRLLTGLTAKASVVLGEGSSLRDFEIGSVDRIETAAVSGDRLLMAVIANESYALADFVAAIGADGDVSFVGSCMASITRDLREFAESIAWDGNHEQLLVAVIKDTRLQDELRAALTPDKTDWESLAPEARTIDEDTTPARFLRGLTKVDIEIEIPEQWRGTNLLLCSRLASLGWGDECILLGDDAGEDGPDLLSLWLGEKEPAGIWLVEGDPTKAGPATLIGEIEEAPGADMIFKLSATLTRGDILSLTDRGSWVGRGVFELSER